MTAVTDPAPAMIPIMGRVAALFRRTRPIAEESPDETRARRRFVQDMIAARPEAFASEQDVQCMLHMYPGRF